MDGGYTENAGAIFVPRVHAGDGFAQWLEIHVATLTKVAGDLRYYDLHSIRT
jgi:hypothetical protein